jgi:hypothetical protein
LSALDLFAAERLLRFAAILAGLGDATGPTGAA